MDPGLLDLLGNYIFPVAITIFLLYERRTTIKELTKAIEANTNSTNALIELIRRP